MNDPIKKRLIRTAVLAAVALVVGAGIAWFQVQNEPAQILKQSDSVQASMPAPGVPIGGPFSLTDHNGNAVTEKDYEDSYKLIYFGFTYCPAICPTELQKMSRALTMLEKEGTDTGNIQPLFITVDPERDTPDVMRDYVSMFHPRLTGLSGTIEQTEAVKKAYRVFAVKVEDPELTEYTVDHSSFIYLMSPDDRLISIYSTEDTARVIANGIADKVFF